jgi:hypothetical protein
MNLLEFTFSFQANELIIGTAVVYIAVHLKLCVIHTYIYTYIYIYMCVCVCVCVCVCARAREPPQLSLESPHLFNLFFYVSLWISVQPAIISISSTE